MSNVIPRHEQIAYTRWRLPRVDGSQDPAAAPAESAPVAEEALHPDLQPKLPTAEEIDQIQKRAREEGFAAGYKEGLAQARAQVAVQVDRLQRLLGVK